MRSRDKMSDEASPPAPVDAAIPAPAEADSARPDVVADPEVKEDVVMKEANGNAEIGAPKEVATEDAPTESKNISCSLPFNV